VEAALAALKAAQRPEEKKLMLSALASVSNAKAAEALKPLLSDPALKTDAALAAASLAESLFRADRSTAKALAQAIKDANASPDAVRRAEALLLRR
jgi:hydroxymethylglutaryl-CoA reductase